MTILLIVTLLVIYSVTKYDTIKHDTLDIVQAKNWGPRTLQQFVSCMTPSYYQVWWCADVYIWRNQWKAYLWNFTFRKGIDRLNKVSSLMNTSPMSISRVAGFCIDFATHECFLAQRLRPAKHQRFRKHVDKVISWYAGDIGLSSKWACCVASSV